MNMQTQKHPERHSAAPALSPQPSPARASRPSRRTRPVRIGIIAPKAGIAGTIGECGLRGTQFAVERINAAGGIAGRKVELVVEEETNPKDSIERLRKLVLQDKVDCVQGIVSSGVSLAMGAVAEEMKALLIFWDGTTQDGVKETMPEPALRLPQHRQRVRGGDGLAAGDQALEGQVRDRSPASTPTTRTAATTSPPSRRC